MQRRPAYIRGTRTRFSEDCGDLVDQTRFVPHKHRQDMLPLNAFGNVGRNSSWQGAACASAAVAAATAACS